MAKKAAQKLKLLHIMELFQKMSDEDHGLSTNEIISYLAENGISAERKTIYSDIEELQNFGLDIIGQTDGRSYRYYLVSRDFELAELKLLVDSVQAAKFISEKKSRELIKKLSSLISEHAAGQLRRQVLIHGRPKTMNESVFYSVDKIYQAINDDRCIRFHYFQWNEKKDMVLRKNGEYYTASPWALVWDDEYYYLVAYDENERTIKHYRVDKMLDIEELPHHRSGKETFASFDVGIYSKQLFGMFGGEIKKVTLECKNEAAGIIIDRFGKDVIMQKIDDEHFIVVTDVAISKQFSGWLFSLSDMIKITAPADVADALKIEAESFLSSF